ncbi:MAG: hypothetical protein HDKAJFGB_03310 [Anaerolineae bacterium]|nr:hypothetical protein [Anaerolineae bacterium]RIK33724.1 MAG: ZIP family zinc transporter [Chloroflexota bacterium]
MVPDWVTAALLGALAASALLIGAGLVIFKRPSSRVIGLVMGFGAGALISSIAYELVPDSTIGDSWIWAIAFATGALVFFGLDWWVDHRGGANRKDIAGDAGGSGLTIFLGTLLDGIPESVILGLGIAAGNAPNIAFLLAVFVSNLPEGMAGTLNLKAAGRSHRDIILMWLGVVVASAISAVIGFAIVRWIPTLDGAYAQAFAAGALLTMLADAMMPEAFEHGGKKVGLLTVMGFLVAATLSALE